MLKQTLIALGILVVFGCAEAENSDPKPQNLVSEENSDTDNSTSNSGPSEALDSLPENQSEPTNENVDSSSEDVSGGQTSIDQYGDPDGLVIIVEDNGVAKAFWAERKQNSITYDDEILNEQDWIDKVYTRHVNWSDKSLGKMKRYECENLLEVKYIGACRYMAFSNEVFEVLVFDRSNGSYEGTLPDGLVIIVEADEEVKSLWAERKQNSITYDSAVQSEQEWIDRVYTRYINWSDKSLGKMKRYECQGIMVSKYEEACSYMAFNSEIFEVLIFDLSDLAYKNELLDRSELVINSEMISVQSYDSVPFSWSNAFDHNVWNGWNWWTSTDLNVQENLLKAQNRLYDMVDQHDLEYVGKVNYEICSREEKPELNNLIFWSIIFEMCEEGIFDSDIISAPHYNLEDIVVYGFVNKEYRDNPNY